jgi:capsid protein
MLATYAGRRPRPAQQGLAGPGDLADMAIIPDADVLNARARQMVRDTWVAPVAVSAFARNVVGCGSSPCRRPRTPTAAQRRSSTSVDARLLDWAGDKLACDVEQDQTFWQMQTLAESERATVGEAFWVWSYEPPLKPNGSIDYRGRSG